MLRRFRPRLVLAPAERDLHPDHEAVGQLVRQASFLAGLEKWETGQEPWRPERILRYMSHDPESPNLVVDVSEHFERKREAALCYRSQFFQENSAERETYIARPEFWDWWEGRHQWFGHFIGVKYGEAFSFDGPLATRDPFHLCTGFGKYPASEAP